MVAGLITELDIDGIISDNRLGVLVKKYLLFYNASIERYDRKHHLAYKQNSKIIKSLPLAGFQILKAPKFSRRLSHIKSENQFEIY
jgi:hypothetical protein